MKATQDSPQTPFSQNCHLITFRVTPFLEYWAPPTLKAGFRRGSIGKHWANRAGWFKASDHQHFKIRDSLLLSASRNFNLKPDPEIKGRRSPPLSEDHQLFQSPLPTSTIELSLEVEAQAGKQS